MEEAPRHPRGRQAEHAPAGVESPIEGSADLFRCRQEGGGHGGHPHTNFPRIQVQNYCEYVVRLLPVACKPHPAASDAAVA